MSHCTTIHVKVIEGGNTSPTGIGHREKKEPQRRPIHLDIAELLALSDYRDSRRCLSGLVVSGKPQNLSRAATFSWIRRA
jgi:hypothetical protein